MKRFLIIFTFCLILFSCKKRDSSKVLNKKLKIEKEYKLMIETLDTYSKKKYKKKTVIDYDFRSFYNEKINLKKYKNNKLIMLSVIDTKHGLSKKQIDIYKKIDKIVDKDRAEIFLLSISETKKSIKRFINRNQCKLNILVDPIYLVRKKYPELFRTESLPLNIIIDRFGNVVLKDKYVNYEKLYKILNRKDVLINSGLRDIKNSVVVFNDVEKKVSKEYINGTMTFNFSLEYLDSYETFILSEFLKYSNEKKYLMLLVRSHDFDSCELQSEILDRLHGYLNFNKLKVLEVFVGSNYEDLIHLKSKNAKYERLFDKRDELRRVYDIRDVPKIMLFDDKLNIVEFLSFTDFNRLFLILSKYNLNLPIKSYIRRNRK